MSRTSAAISPSSNDARKAGALAPATDWGGAGLSRLQYFRVSSLRTFEMCPHTWATRWLGGKQDRDSPAAAVGTAVHTIAESVLAATFGIGDELELASKVAEAFQVVPVEEQAACERYVKSFSEFDGWQLLALEHEFTLQMHHGMPPIRGHIDAVLMSPDGTVLVLDHKTNRQYDGVEYWSNQLQMLLYAWAVRQMCPGRPVRFRIGYVNLGSNVEWQTNESDDEPLRERMLNIWSDMQVYAAAGHWPQRINKECSWCPVKAGCKEHNESIVNFRRSFLELGSTTTADKLQYARDVQKLAKAAEEEMEVQLMAEVEAAGGRLEQSGKVWTIAPGPSRRIAAFAQTWPALIHAAQQPGAENVWEAVGLMANDIMTVKVGGLDKLAAMFPELSKVIESCTEKKPGAPTLKGVEVGRGK